MPESTLSAPRARRHGRVTFSAARRPEHAVALRARNGVHQHSSVGVGGIFETHQNLKASIVV